MSESLKNNPQLDIRERIRQEHLKCASDPVYFMKKYYTIQHPTQGRQLFDLYEFQEKTIRLFHDNEFVIVNKGRQLGISTLVSAYALWLMLFHKDKNVLVIATTQMTAKNMVTKVRFAYSNLPTFLKLEAEEDNRLSLRLRNGSQIKAVSAAGDASRSEAVSLLVIDEAAFIDNIQEIFTAAQSTLATGGRCLAISTPNGQGNWFHVTFTKAQRRENKFLPISLPWTVHPERDEEWRKQQDVELGPRAAAQENDCDFAASGATFIDPLILKWYEENTVIDPNDTEFGEKTLPQYEYSYWKWEQPRIDGYYLMVADVARGDGLDYSTFHVIDIDRLEQVAEFRYQLDTRDFARLLTAVATEWNYALLVIEHASIGWDVIQSVVESGYSNVYYGPRGMFDLDFVNYLQKYDNGSGMIPGFSTNMRTRPLVLEKLKAHVEGRALIIKSMRTMHEFRTFIWKNGKAQAQQGFNDDLIIPLAIAMYLRETSLKFRKTAEQLTHSALGNFSKTEGPFEVYRPSFVENTNWKITIGTPNGTYDENLNWLL